MPYFPEMGNWGEGWFGDGFDGNAVLSGDATLAVIKRYQNLTIDAGVTLNPAGYPIYVRGTLTLNGAISVDGNAGMADGTPGAARANPAIYDDESAAGGAGGVAIGADGGNRSASEGSNGGAGGAGSLGAGGAAGIATKSSANRRNWGNLIGGIIPGILQNQFSATGYLGGAGGGGGGGDGVAGGGGGGGGGVCVVVARTIECGVAGRISSKGGAGGSPLAGNRGGGGGGGGGVVALVYQSISGLTVVQAVLATGGGFGIGQGTGANGVIGVAGYAEGFQI